MSRFTNALILATILLPTWGAGPLPAQPPSADPPGDRTRELERRLEKLERALQAIREAAARHDLPAEARLREIEAVLRGAEPRAPAAVAAGKDLHFRIQHLRPTTESSAPCQPTTDRCCRDDHWNVTVSGTSFSLTPDGLAELEKVVGSAAASARGPDAVRTPDDNARFTAECPPLMPYRVMEYIMESGIRFGFRHCTVTVPAPDGRGVPTTSPLILPRNDQPCHREEEPPGGESPTQELRVMVAPDQNIGGTCRWFQSRRLPEGKIGDDILFGMFEQEVKAAAAKGRPVLLILDAGPNVPWKDAAAILEIAKKTGIADAEFSFGWVLR